MFLKGSIIINLHACKAHKSSATTDHISQIFGGPHSPSRFLGIETAASYLSTMNTIANLGHVRCLYFCVVCLLASPHVCWTLSTKQRLGNDVTPMSLEFIKTALRDMHRLGFEGMLRGCGRHLKHLRNRSPSSFAWEATQIDEELTEFPALHNTSLGQSPVQDSE